MASEKNKYYPLYPSTTTVTSGSSSGDSTPAGKGLPSDTVVMHDLVIADASKMVEAMATPAEGPPDKGAPGYVGFMTKLKFGSSEPDSSAICNSCGLKYGAHSSFKCKHEGQGVSTGTLATEEYAQDGQPEEDWEVMDSEAYLPIEADVAGSTIHPDIEIITAGKRLATIKKYRTFDRPMVPPSVVATKYPLMAATATWYVLESIKNIHMSKALPARKLMRSFGRFEEWLAEEYNALTTELAIVFFDYMALATWGEARHAWNYCSMVAPETSYKGNRNLAAREALHFNPKRFLPLLEKLFKVAVWSGGSFGGQRWGKAAEYAQKYGKVPNNIFLDVCVDLVHNSGTLFSKPYIIEPVTQERWQRLLSYKSGRKDGLVGSSHTMTFPSFPLAEQAVQRAITLEILPQTWKAATNSSKTVEQPTYKPLKWGKAEVALKLVSTPRSTRCKICAGIAGLCTCLKCSTCKAVGCLKHRYCEICGGTKFVKDKWCCDPYKGGKCNACGKNVLTGCTCTFTFGGEYESEKQTKKKAATLPSGKTGG